MQDNMERDYDMIHIIPDEAGLTPNNVLAACLDKMEEITLVGKSKDGKWYCASSERDPKEVLRALKYFKHVIKEQMK